MMHRRLFTALIRVSSKSFSQTFLYTRVSSHFHWKSALLAGSGSPTLSLYFLFLMAPQNTCGMN